MAAGTYDWSKYWAACGPAMEAWQAFVMSSVVGMSRASMMWMMMPIEVGQKFDADRRSGGTGIDVDTVMRHAFDAHKRAETYASGAYASSLDAGRRSFQQFEAMALDQGTVDLSLIGHG